MSIAPLACLEDDVKDFFIDLSHNTKVVAYLEKERKSVEETMERRKGLELLQSQRIKLSQQHLEQEMLAVQLEDYDLMNLSRTQSMFYSKLSDE